MSCTTLKYILSSNLLGIARGQFNKSQRRPRGTLTFNASEKEQSSPLKVSSKGYEAVIFTTNKGIKHLIYGLH